MADYIDELGLTRWFFRKCDAEAHSAFPSLPGTTYAQALRETHAYLNANVHPKVGARAAAANPGVFLTDHGPDHIRLVIKRAQFLIAKDAWACDDNRAIDDYEPCLRPYEVFLLLMAIHFHDVGNIYGRDGHEARIVNVMKNIPILAGRDSFELTQIARIASAHGGTVDGNRDTIGLLPAKQPFGSEVTYRPQLIAAVLRLADELADERSRADSFSLRDPAGLPAGSQIFHRYAEALVSVSVEASAQQISLKFLMTRATASLRLEHRGAPAHLLDYIYERVLKTYREMVYCSRFMRDLDCQLHRVAVQIEAICDELDANPKETIAFRIGDCGYPGDQHGGLDALSPDFKGSPAGNDLESRLNECCKPGNAS